MKQAKNARTETISRRRSSRRWSRSGILPPSRSSSGSRVPSAIAQLPALPDVGLPSGSTEVGSLGGAADGSGFVAAGGGGVPESPGLRLRSAISSYDSGEIGREHVRTHVHNGHLVSRLLLEKKTRN